MTGLRAVRAVPGARRLFLGSIVGRLPLGMESLALLLYFEGRYSSYALAGGLVALFALAGAGLTPLVVPLVARYGAARVVAACAVAQSAAFVGVLVAVEREAPRALTALLVVVAGFCGPPISACARTAWRAVAPTPEVREAGYTLDAVSQELIWLAGPLLVTCCLLVAGPAGAMVLTTALVLAGAGYFATSPLLATVRPSLGVGARPRFSRAVHLMLAATAATGFGFGALEVAVPALADRLGHQGAAGLLLGAMSVGSILGGIAYGSRPWRSSVALRHAVAAGILAVLTAALVLGDTVPAALALALLAGLGWSPVLASQYALFAELTSDRDTVAAFTWSTTAVIIGVAVGSACAGLTVERAGVDTTFVLAGAAFGLVTLLGLAVAGREVSAPRPRR